MDWWTAEDAKRFDEGANCIVKQFDAYVVDGDVHQKGALVQGESIADLGGLTIAYRAYKKSLQGKPEPAPIEDLSGDERFFIANGRIRGVKQTPGGRAVWPDQREPSRQVPRSERSPTCGVCGVFGAAPGDGDGARVEVKIW